MRWLVIVGLLTLNVLSAAAMPVTGKARPAQDGRLRQLLHRRAETDRSCMKLLPAFHNENHVKPWTAKLPVDPARHYYRGATLTVDQMVEVLRKGFPARKTRSGEVYFSARPADAMSYALPGYGTAPELRDGKFVAALFRVDACRLPTPGQASEHRTAGDGKNVPANWFTGVWVLDPKAESDARRLLRIDDRWLSGARSK